MRMQVTCITMQDKCKLECVFDTKQRAKKCKFQRGWLDRGLRFTSRKGHNIFKKDTPRSWRVMMKHASEAGVEVPAEGFRDEKCTFLVLSRVPGTPITTKICRDFKETLETTLGAPPTRFGGHWRWPTRFGKGGWSAYQKRWSADHLVKIWGSLVLSHSNL